AGYLSAFLVSEPGLVRNKTSSRARLGAQQESGHVSIYLVFRRLNVYAKKSCAPSAVWESGE
ncbi:MAG: hypothetical protein WCQ69_10730, partial [Bacteroidales bacterium]